MATAGRYGFSALGTTLLMRQMWSEGSGQGTALAAVNNAVCFRFRADTTRDIKAININWQSLTTPGTVSVRIETIDAATGKPTGTLYDASASKSVTPSDAGTDAWQTVTFDTLPTAGLVPDTFYGVVVIATGAGTTQNIRSAIADGALNGDTALLTATDGSTRSNFAEPAGEVPIFTLTYEDDAEECPGACPWIGAFSYDIYGARAAALKFTVAANTELSGAQIDLIVRSGTPDNLRIRVLDSSDTVLKSVTLDKDMLANITARSVLVHFGSALSLAAGTYRLVVDQRADGGGASSTTAANYYRITRVQGRTATTPTGLNWSSTSDINAGTISWTDVTKEQPMMSLLVRDFVPSGGGGTTVNVFNVME